MQTILARGAKHPQTFFGVCGCFTPKSLEQYLQTQSSPIIPRIFLISVANRFYPMLYWT